MATEVSEFERVVWIGLGRAILALKTTDPRPHSNVILDACLHDLGFDTQVEGSRAQYVFDLINLSGEPAYLSTQVLSALKTETEYYNLSQLFELARLFAEKGNEEAREVMYARFAANSVDTTLDRGMSDCGAEEIILLDGIPGFLFVAEKLGERALTKEDYWDNRYLGYLLSVAEERDGAEAVRRQLQQFRLQNETVAAYLQLIEGVEKESREAARSGMDYAKLSYDDLKGWIESSDSEYYAGATRWGRHANQESIERAAKDLLLEEDPTRLYAYLRVFWKRPFPFSPEPLIAHARNDDDKIARGALGALENIRHPLVRELALHMLAIPTRAYMAIDLLAENYEQGDHVRIESALEAAIRLADENVYHWLGFGALKVFETNPTPDAASALSKIYENGPCSSCRERTFDLLQELNVLPEWMIEECSYDANLDLREKAAFLRR